MIAAVVVAAAFAALPFTGSWTGTLTERDTGSGRTVVRSASLEVTPQRDGFHFAYAYENGAGPAARAEADVSADADAQTYRVRDESGDATYRADGLAAFLQRGGGTLVLRRDAADGARESIDLGATALVTRRLVRAAGGALATEQIYRFTRILPPSAFAEDADVLRRAYEALHPGLYRYQTPAQAGARFAELERDLAAARTIPQAYLAFSRFTASVRCGHSYPNPSNQPHALAEALFDGTNRLPFSFVWLRGRMIVTANFSGDPALAPGTDVLAVDGHPAGEILARLTAFARADGANDAKRVDEMQASGTDRYDAFDRLFPLVFPARSTRVSLVVRPYGAARAHTVDVDAESETDRYARVAAREAAVHGDGPLWTFRDLDPSVAYVRMPTWETYLSQWDWRGSIDRAFAQLASRGTPNLIVDLRGNEGGTDVGDAIVAHLIDAPLASTSMRRLVRYRAIPPALAPYLDTWDPSFKDWGAAAVPYDDRFFRLTRYDDGPDGTRIAPRAPRYRGRVWVLVDAANSSATFQFDALVQRARLATLAGAPTGGNQRGINGGAFFFVRLPNTGIEVDLPLIGTFPERPAPDAGLVPEIAVEREQSDIARGRDAVLETVLARAHERAARGAGCATCARRAR